MHDRRGDARLEGTIDTQCKLRGAAEIDGAAVITKFADAAPPDVGHQRMNVVAMMSFGVGWGPNGLRGSMFLGVDDPEPEPAVRIHRGPARQR